MEENISRNTSFSSSCSNTEEEKEKYKDKDKELYVVKGYEPSFPDDFTNYYTNFWYKRNILRSGAYVIALMSTLKFVNHGAIKLHCGVYMIKKDYDGSPTKETCALLGVPIKLISDFLIDESQTINMLKKAHELDYIDDIKDITTVYISSMISTFLPFFKNYDTTTDLILLNIEPKGYGNIEYKYPTPRITIPGGKMQKSDLFDFESCGFREFKEETGLDITHCHEKISREKVRSNKKYNQSTLYHKKFRFYPLKQTQQNNSNIFESMYYLVRVK